MRVELYIADTLVDLSDESLILMNYTFEDLNNPTVVKNSYSKQITLKGTKNNNALFGHIYKPDRVTEYGDGYTGIYFDKLRKTPFIITNEMGEVLESGYIKLDSVTRKGDAIEYKITLYGGLGSFFYQLKYNEDGTDKTLFDLTFLDVLGNPAKDSVGFFNDNGGYYFSRYCWDYLTNEAAYIQDAQALGPNDPDFNYWANIINFAPCYNGLPNNFSSDKAVIDNKQFENVPVSRSQDGVIYGSKAGTSSVLMSFKNKHTEWEIRDLRWYLQRPVVSIKAIIEACCLAVNNGGYEVELSNTFRTHPLFLESWATLQMIPIEERRNDDALRNVLKTTKSPADYLISFAKLMGLVMWYDSEQEKVRIMTRQEFYKLNDEVVDLTDRIDAESIVLNHKLTDAKYYQFGGGAIGEFAENYKADYGIDYGVQRVNTGNEFNNETKIVTDKIIFKDAADVLERNLLYRIGPLLPNGEEYFLPAFYEDVTVQLWASDEAIEVPIITKFDHSTTFFENSHPLVDYIPKVQLHTKDNKSIDGSDVLLVFDRMYDSPTYWGTAIQKSWYRFTDDILDMDTLNGDTPCWNFTRKNCTWLTRIPCFRRYYLNDEGDTIEHSFEWGNPRARGVYDVDPGDKSLYDQWWKKFQTDRYSGDTFAMTCKANLRGLKVNQLLLGRFYYYEGSLFVLNKVRNHSLTTEDLTECEFIKVNDPNNYKD